MDDGTKILTHAEVAVALGVAEVTVRRWAADGRITPIRTRPLLYSAGDVELLAAELAGELGDMVREAVKSA